MFRPGQWCFLKNVKQLQAYIPGKLAYEKLCYVRLLLAVFPKLSWPKKHVLCPEYLICA